MPSSARNAALRAENQNCGRPSSFGFQPMPAFCVQPNRSPLGECRSISSVSGNSPVGPAEVVARFVYAGIGWLDELVHGSALS